MPAIAALACFLAAVAPSMAKGPLSAVDFTYEDINPNSPTHGQRLSLSELYSERGVILNFLASWCTYCWKELPELERLQSSISTPIVGVAADEYEGPQVLLGLIKQAELKMPVLLVPKSDIEKMAQTYDHSKLPATYVIDKNGWVRDIFEGLAPMDKLVRAVAPRPES
jgi:thiol-disulfide isomerase/thioredoxin